jgi:hypothetical protein
MRKPLERELCAATSLLWRLRRATAIDTGLLQIPSDIDRISELAKPANEMSVGVVEIGQFRNEHELHSYKNEESAGQPDLALNADISRRFLRLDPGSVERLGRHTPSVTNDL